VWAIAVARGIITDIEMQRFMRMHRGYSETRIEHIKTQSNLAFYSTLAMSAIKFS